jgi:hypothetical protein
MAPAAVKTSGCRGRCWGWGYVGGSKSGKGSAADGIHICLGSGSGGSGSDDLGSRVGPVVTGSIGREKTKEFSIGLGNISLEIDPGPFRRIQLFVPGADGVSKGSRFLEHAHSFTSSSAFETGIMAGGSKEAVTFLGVYQTVSIGSERSRWGSNHMALASN